MHNHIIRAVFTGKYKENTRAAGEHIIQALAAEVGKLPGCGHKTTEQRQSNANC